MDKKIVSLISNNGKPTKTIVRKLTGYESIEQINKLESRMQITNPKEHQPINITIKKDATFARHQK